ncbi:MAG: hypothetical protein ACYCW6_29005, partial [Candidatus Xenobia bacterium]
MLELAGTEGWSLVGEDPPYPHRLWVHFNELGLCGRERAEWVDAALRQAAAVEEAAARHLVDGLAR